MLATTDSPPGNGQGVNQRKAVTDAFERLPHSLLVIGGGCVGCELGLLFARAAAKIAFAYRSRLLPAAAPEISAALARHLGEEGVMVAGGLAYQKIRQAEGGDVLDTTKHGSLVTFEADRVLVATSRPPDTEGWGLTEAKCHRDLPELAIGPPGPLLRADPEHRKANRAAAGSLNTPRCGSAQMFGPAPDDQATFFRAAT